MQAWIPTSISVRAMNDPPGGRTIRHEHFYVQAGYVVSGYLSVELNRRQVWRINPGEFFNIAQYQPHIIRNPPDQPVETLDLRFKARLVGGIRLDVPDPGLEAMGLLVNSTFMVDGSRARWLAPMLRDLLHLESVPCDVRMVILGVRLLRLAQRLAKAPRRTLPRGGGVAPRHEAVVTALDMLHTRYQEPLTVGDLARAAGVSPGHLTRLFRRDVGATPKQYLLHHRIEWAKRLMTSDRQSLKAVAFAVGFRDFQQFSRAFRRIQGCAPSAFAR